MTPNIEERIAHACREGRICIYCDCPVYTGAPSGSPIVVYRLVDREKPYAQWSFEMDFCIHEHCLQMIREMESLPHKVGVVDNFSRYRNGAWTDLLRMKAEARRRGEPTEPYL